MSNLLATSGWFSFVLFILYKLLRELWETSGEQLGGLVRCWDSWNFAHPEFLSKQKCVCRKNIFPGQTWVLERERAYWRQISVPKTPTGLLGTKSAPSSALPSLGHVGIFPSIQIRPEGFVPVNSSFPVIPHTSPRSRVSHPRSSSFTCG